MTLRGGIITRRPLCYTIDGRLLLAPCGTEIRVYSAKSGDHIATMTGHDAEVTAVVQDPSSNKMVYSCSLDGTFRQWDIHEGVNLQTWTVGEPIESMVYSKPTGLAYVSVHYKGKDGRVLPYSLPSGTEVPGRVKLSKPRQLYISPSGRHLAAGDKHSLLVWAAGGSAPGNRAQPLNLHHTKAYTCAAFDATDSIIAAGDITGRVLIWHNYAQSLDAAAAGNTAALEVQLPVCTTVHWHAHPVGALCFSLDGSYLMSGGQEGVLVQWALPTNKRNYLPHLGGPLRGIYTSRADPAKFVVAHADNTVRVINMATMAVELSIHGLRPPPAAGALAAVGYGHCCSSGSSSPAGGVVQPGSGLLVLQVEHSMLQFYDAVRDRHVGRLQVSARNPVSLTNSTASQPALGVAPQPQAAVVLVGFTADGNSLITVDIQPSTGVYGSTAAESTLRFWDRSTSSQAASTSIPYTLNTSTDNPHQGTVTGLACHPLHHMAVTTGSEGGFRVWQRSKPQRGLAGRISQGTGGGSSSSSGHWRCSAVGSYKGIGFSSCTFSQDGSLLAVAAGSKATLWDPYKNNLIAVLCAPSDCSRNGSSLRQLLFLQNTPHLVGLLGGGDPTAALAAVGLSPARSQDSRVAQVLDSWGSTIIVWDLLSGAVAWHCSMPVCSLAADPVRSVFAVGVPAVLPATVVTAAANAIAAGPAEQRQKAKNRRKRPETAAKKAAKAAKVEAAAAAGDTDGNDRQDASMGQAAIEIADDNDDNDDNDVIIATQDAAEGTGQPLPAGQTDKQQQQLQQQQQRLQPWSKQHGHQSQASKQQHQQHSQQQQQNMQSQHTQGLVLVFSPSDPQPLLACPVPNRSPASLLFTSRSDNGQATAAAAGRRCSPLLMLTHDRRYAWLQPSAAPFAAAEAKDANTSLGEQTTAAAAAVANGPGSFRLPSGTRAAMEADVAAGRDESALEAMFGKSEPSPAAPGGGGNNGKAMAAEEAANVKAAVLQLFDAPSHVLPAPSTLCPTLLELLIGANRR